jgi:hypothetical protein
LKERLTEPDLKDIRVAGTLKARNKRNEKNVMNLEKVGIKPQRGPQGRDPQVKINRWIQKRVIFTRRKGNEEIGNC